MERLILKHSLWNAIEHEGKANENAVLGKVLAEDPELKLHINDVKKEITRIVTEVNAMSDFERQGMLKQFHLEIPKEKKKEEGLPELDNAVKGKVVMRLAPYPSGPLHIGNARMVVLNDEYVKKYRGKLLLVVDDTIGSEEKFVVKEAYDLIIDGLKWLGVKWSKVLFKSDRLKYFYQVAEEMLEKDLAYVCECESEILRKNRTIGQACVHRGQSPEENLEKWNNMLKGKYKEGTAVVRLKNDMNHPNPAFRDRVLLRIVERKHPRVGNKYRVWPLLEFSWAVDDHLLGVTHVLRGKDLVIEDIMEEFIWDKLGWKKAEFVHYGLLLIEGVKTSKTRDRHLIEEKKYFGWDDPRTWSMQSLKRRGIQPDAIRSFVKNLGLSKADVEVPAEILYAENRKIIDSKANRYMAVLDPVKISLSDAPKINSISVDLHPDFSRRGKRKIPIDVNKIYIEKEEYQKYSGKDVGLMYFSTVNIGEISRFVSKDVSFDLQKIHWVSEPNVGIKIVMPDGSVKDGIGEVKMKKLKKDQLIQLVRIGFCRVDKVNKDVVLYYAHK